MRDRRTLPVSVIAWLATARREALASPGCQHAGATAQLPCQWSPTPHILTKDAVMRRLVSRRSSLGGVIACTACTPCMLSSDRESAPRVPASIMILGT